ncbi:hypothetical protein TL16_g03590 [Triparma laevis f. inornata]|uniref:AB hydrolase-1 domain-containing protein n=1 Tax=Triparma laevis f. inornata TaxID=1714386 RepID=A0A9W7E016_9STRA|nr:hypothetical protein TL16_g03590 [Triparma laevis f. inornata]
MFSSKLLLNLHISPPTSSTLYLLLFLYLSLELLFLTYTLLLNTSHQKRLKPPKYPIEKKLFISRILKRLEDIYSTSPETQREAVKDFLKGWCLEAPFEEIKKGNILEFLSWAMCAVPVEELSGRDEEEIDTFFMRLKEKYGIVLPPGYNKNVKCCTLTLDPVTYNPRPILFYIIVACLNITKTLTLTFLGFSKLRTENSLSYWYRPSAPNSTSSPLLFFHGIAPCGPLFYLPLIFNSLLTSDRDIYLFSNSSVDMTLRGSTALTEFDVLDGVEEALNTPENSIKKWTIAGHSLGSCPVTWLLRAFPHKITTVVLLDPVTLFLSHPAVACNFVYKQKFNGLIEVIIWFAASTEQFIAKYLKRDFWWYRNELWVETIPPHINVLIVVSRNDEIVDASLLEYGFKQQRNLGQIKENVKLKIIDGGHAIMIAMPGTWRMIERELKAMEKVKGE